MSEQAKRSLEDIQKDYQSLCLKAGHIQYQIYVHTSDLGLLNDQIKDLNFEAAKLHSAQAPATEPVVEAVPAQQGE